MTPDLKVLLVDDDKNIRQTLEVTLRTMNCEVKVATSVAESLTLISQENFDLILTDYKLVERTGLEIVSEAHRLKEAPIVIMMTAYASFDSAVMAIKEGAYDYMPKPFSNAQLAHALTKVRTLVGLKRENARLRSFDFFTGMTSPAMIRLKEFVDKTAPTDATLLMVGESGTGKSELARVIHQQSPRAKKPYLVMSALDLSDDPLSKIESARGGTIFLDEISDLTPSAQNRWLHFLQEPSVDVRVIAATFKDLTEAVKAGTFREDLYYRLNIFECSLVALRYRGEDIPVLIEKFLRESSQLAKLPSPPSLSPSLLQRLCSYSWPGNVRELKNTMERLVILSGAKSLNEEDLPQSFRKVLVPQNAGSHIEAIVTLADLERAHIERVLQAEPHQERAAELLGITTVTLWRKRKQYGLP